MRSLVTRTLLMSLRRFIVAVILVVFTMTTAVPSYAQSVLSLPAPGVRVSLSPAFVPPTLKGIKIYPENPFRFDFILDKGEKDLTDEDIKSESSRLIKYFLASLTIPEKDLWVNLSPYEKDRIVPDAFGKTEMGRDLLAEDYLLKQITASLIYPEDEVGKTFWKRVYEEAQKKFGTTDIPVNTFNKVWIVPAKAVVYENAQAGTAYVVESKLKVMLESDYLALQKSELKAEDSKETNELGKQIVREVVIPLLEKEVNEGMNFARLRQVYQSLILAAWYKTKIKDSILAQVYSDKNKVAGVNIDDPNEKQKIYERYLQAFKKGVYNYIKEDYDSAKQETIPRKYFSGGVQLEFDFVTNLDVRSNFKIISNPKAVDEHPLEPGRTLLVAAGANIAAFSPEQLELPLDHQVADRAMMSMDSAHRIYDHILSNGFSHLTNDLFDDNNLLNALSTHQVVNPDNRPLRAIYGGSGTDVSSALIMLGSTENYFVSHFKDLTVQDLEWVVRALKVLQKEGNDALFRLGNPQQMLSYLDAKHEQGGAHSKDSEFKPYVMMGLVLEFSALKIFDIQIDDDLGVPRIRFQWDHFGLLPKKEYSIMLIDADITDPDNYPSVLKERISQGFDAYLQKRGWHIPKAYKTEGSRNFIRVLHSGMHPGAWFVTDDRYPLAETKLPSGEIRGNYDGDASLDFPLEKNQFTESKELPFDEQQGRPLRLRKVEDRAMLAREEKNRSSKSPYKVLYEEDATGKQIYSIVKTANGRRKTLASATLTNALVRSPSGKVISDLHLFSIQSYVRGTTQGVGRELMASIYQSVGYPIISAHASSLEGRELLSSAGFEYYPRTKVSGIDINGTWLSNPKKMHTFMLRQVALKLAGKALIGLPDGLVDYYKASYSVRLGKELEKLQKGDKERRSVAHESTIDNTQLSDTKGGIDFNADKMNLQVQNNGNGIKFNLDPAMLEQLQNAPGFTPVIINIQPMIDLHLFLGLADNQSAPQTASL